MLFYSPVAVVSTLRKLISVRSLQFASVSMKAIDLSRLDDRILHGG